MEDNPMPEGCHHYSSLGEVPWDLQKYWQQRYSIFSKYDHGIWMTDDAWFGITPEPVATTVADYLAQSAPADRSILIDAFSGAGGNTIAFARSQRWDRIMVIEKDPAVMECAKNNARIYGVEEKISWVVGDVYEVLENIPDDIRNSCVVFASPPWGGPGYSSDPVFNLMTLQPYSLEHILQAFRNVTDHVVLYLPRTSDLRQLAAFLGDGEKIRAVHYCMYGASKGLCAYFGPSFVSKEGAA